jgi:7-cyano-7-deazaguanine reductase
VTASAKPRELLAVAPSPDPRHDYLVGLEGMVGTAAVAVRYVPDRLIATAESAVGYFAALDAGAAVEALALTVLDDFNNELVPRWIEVLVRRDQPLRHWAQVEDRQPGWENAQIFSRSQ